MVGPRREGGNNSCMHQARLWIYFLLLLALPTQAMEFSLKPLSLGASGQVQALHLEGVIQEGDGQRLTKFLEAMPADPAKPVLWLALNSEGGSVREALVMARQLRNWGFVAHTPAQSKCISACILLYASGLVRVANVSRDGTPFTPNIGVHRAFISREFLAKLSLSQAQALTRQMYVSLERAFQEFDIPAAIFQSAMTTSSSQVRWLSEAETRSLGTYPAWFDEYLLARCERLQEPGMAADMTQLTREKSGCAMRLIQAHRRQVQAATALKAEPAVAD